MGWDSKHGWKLAGQDLRPADMGQGWVGRWRRGRKQDLSALGLLGAEAN